ncbi:glycosyltransferase [Paraburkholderia sp. BL21I4N1]|uniref:glycosyltransferase n=1 Tax=Paraburkholderia sp. BL21I4N1 TaxID=1938801 RepID=UPI000D461A33|nr:glycosyltransferase [Paraburkholderia sp. BL21I4N1]PQV49070.1 glycosyltransferase involved in cell wall biosynthesis [Paraburkholderia sp. BL21I4N1]
MGGIIKALFIVEPDFLSLHVGVRRVILYYAAKLENRGWRVTFGAPKEGKIFRGQFSARRTATHVQPSRAPYWSSRTGNSATDQTAAGSRPPFAIQWSEETIDPDEFDVNVVTAPWVCDLGVPPMPRVVGIVYDLVPNLLATGCLRFPNELDVYDFAQQHDVGFRYYLANAERIACISDSTRVDFMSLYRTANRVPSVITDISFECTASQLGTQATRTVLLVNVLDWRKNLKNIELILTAAARLTSFRLRVVGKERIGMADALRFFSNMENLGLDVEWYRDVDDAVLANQYAQASVLLFPSVYEGLGLPILEAQEYGVPAITSNVSSCSEVNMNPGICFDPTDVAGMTASLVELVNGESDVLQGAPLRAALDRFLASNCRPLDVFTF